MKRLELIRNITYNLTHLSNSIESLGKIRLLDLNIAAEHFYKELLNNIFQYNLINLNTYNSTTPAIDLGDTGNGIAVQVTSERRSNKIQKTIDQFLKNGLASKYQQLKVVIIGKRTGLYPNLTIPAGLAFKAKDDVIDIDDIIMEINSQDTASIERIHELIKKELDIPPHFVTIEQMSTKDSLIILRNFMDRSALQDKWDREYSYRRFGESITEMIEAIATGKTNGIMSFKSMFKIEDKTTRERLSLISNNLKNLRSMLSIHIKSGEIDLDSNVCRFHSKATEDSFNANRKLIVHTFNSIASDHGIPNLPDRL